MKDPFSPVSVFWHLGAFPPALGHGALLLAETWAVMGPDRPIELTVIEQGRRLSPAVAAVFERVDGVLLVRRVAAFPVAPTVVDAWPSWDEDAVLAHEIDTTERIQQAWCDTGRRPRLAMAEELRHAARRTLAGVSNWAPVFVVHLKNQPGPAGQSNARSDIWCAFMRGRVDCHFLLIGHDAVSADIAALPNVTVLAETVPDLALHLACIGEGAGYLAMQSGPANFAICSATPYILFKNPVHHAAEMVREIGGKDHYPFATPRQRIWREWESVDVLNRAVNLMLEGA